MSSVFVTTASSHNLETPIKEEQQLTESMRNCSISSAGTVIDIDGRLASADILVALLDRPAEMKDLVLRNKSFYETLENYITETQGSEAWQHFQDILYKPRERLPDRIWMNQISHYLAQNPVFLNTFKESVGYDDDDDDTAVSTPPSKQAYPLPPRKLSASRSSGSVSTVSSLNNNGTRRRGSRRLSSMSSIRDSHNDEDYFHFEEIHNDHEGMFLSEDQFYHDNHAHHHEPMDLYKRRRSSCHSIQAEPHPTFVDFKIDEVDEVNVDVNTNDDRDAESDHLADLLEQNTDSDDSDDYNNTTYNEVQQTSERKTKNAAAKGNRHKSADSMDVMDLLRLRDYPEFQFSLPQTHASFFAKAKRLMSIAPSSRRLSAAIRRNSILEDSMPSSPVTELDEPHIQICLADDEYGGDNDSLERLICCTRRQQPDDIAWLNSIMEKLAGWPELVDSLLEIVQEPF
ncbi:hypothetical protein BDF20DRAFT_881613 [Mycotypha africana]|uniref:uncharacterized protein n=1 Tax=Mycotypha africana TaxID=64632 RepID=UPI00230068A9|nr:uncharacterized protein BDF20DRAFT_881613 [Mycotypha africana]KAI8973300.1 hypothetical protein BDF20DRAFT_881613 [Mycotypha africana]